MLHHNAKSCHSTGHWVRRCRRVVALSFATFIAKHDGDDLSDDYCADETVTLQSELLLASTVMHLIITQCSDRVRVDAFKETRTGLSD